MPWRRSQFTGATPTEVAGYNPKRRSLALFNAGDDPMWFSQDPSNLATTGFRLEGRRGVVLNIPDGDHPDLPLYALPVTSTVTIDLRLQEGVGMQEEEGP